MSTHKEPLLLDDNPRSRQSSIIYNDEDDKKYTEEPWRFVNLAIFLLICLVNGLPTHTFTPINSIIRQVFGYSKVAIATNTLLFPISHPILAFLANYVLDKFGLKMGCSIGAICLLIGVWFRVMIKSSLVPVIIGSFFAAVGNIFIINSPSKFASTWFRPSVVARITTLGVMCTMGSMALGVALPPYFVNSKSTKSQIQNMLIYEAIIVSIPSIILLILFKNKPKQPPSFAAGVSQSRSYFNDLKSLFKNKNYLILLLGVSMSYGSLTCFTTVIEYIILPFNYNEPQSLASSILLVAIISGVVSSIVFVLILKTTRAFKIILILAMIGASVQLLCFMFSLASHKLWLVLIITAQVGFFFVPQIPIFLQFGCQVVFPIGEASSSGFLLAGGQLTGFITGMVAISNLSGTSKSQVYVVVGVLALMLAIGAISMLFAKEDLKRQQYEMKQSQLSQKGD